MIDQSSAVRRMRHLEEPVAEGPGRQVKFSGEAGHKTYTVRGIVPCFVGHKRPAHELRARIVGIGIIIENVLCAYSAGREHDPRDVTLVSQLKRTCIDIFLLAPEPNGLTNEYSSEVHIGNCGPQSEGFAIRKTLDAERFAQAESLP